MAIFGNAALKGSFSARNFLVILAISTSSLSFGYSAGAIGTTLGQPSFLAYMGLLTRSNATSLIGAMVCSYYVGGVFGAAYGGWAADKWGRRNSQIQANITIAIGGVLQTAAQDPAMFIIGRILVGIG
jgi:MFS family permease